jgi:hypothetical protein
VLEDAGTIVFHHPRMIRCRSHIKV